MFVAINNRGNYICAKCGMITTLTRDHFIPRSFLRKSGLDGSYTYTVGLCGMCNRTKSDKIVSSEWYGYLSEYDRRLLKENQREILDYVERKVQGKEMKSSVKESYDSKLVKVENFEQIMFAIIDDSYDEILTDTKYNWLQVREIRLGIAASVNYAVYASTMYDACQMREIRLGLQNGIDISKYASRENNWEVMREIRLGLQQGIDLTEVNPNCKDFLALRKSRVAIAETRGFNPFIQNVHMARV